MGISRGLYLHDTTVISDLMRDPQGAAAQQAMALNRIDGQTRFITSMIVDCELRYGLARKAQARLQAAQVGALGAVLGTAVLVGADKPFSRAAGLQVGSWLEDQENQQTI